MFPVSTMFPRFVCMFVTGFLFRVFGSCTHSMSAFHVFFFCLFVCFFGEFSNSSKTSEEMLSLLDCLQKYVAT
jgi:hypothetical protein